MTALEASFIDLKEKVRWYFECKELSDKSGFLTSKVFKEIDATFEHARKELKRSVCFE